MNKTIAFLILLMLPLSAFAANTLPIYGGNGWVRINTSGHNGTFVCMEDGTTCPVGSTSFSIWFIAAGNTSSVGSVTNGTTVNITGAAGGPISVTRSSNTIIINSSGGGASDGNNYSTNITVTNDSGSHTITIGRNGLSALTATFNDQTGGGGGGIFDQWRYNTSTNSSIFTVTNNTLISYLAGTGASITHTGTNITFACTITQYTDSLAALAVVNTTITRNGTVTNFTYVYTNNMTIGATQQASIYTANDNTLYLNATRIKVVGELNVTGVSSDGTGKVVCIKSDGNFGTCTTVVGISGECTCA